MNKAKDIQEGNKLIAEFMGGKYDANEYWWVLPNINTMVLEYHTSWDWLMPVVEKIPTLNPDKGRLWFEFEISRCHCRIYTNIDEEWKNNGSTTLEATWKTVNDFLTWYNQNKTS